MSNPLIKFFTVFFLSASVLGTAQAQPAAQFSATPVSGCAPLVVSFTDQSTGNPTSWQWDLGNSTISFLQNPSATYFNPGVYTVKLTATNANGSNTIIKTQYVTVYALPVAAFTAPVLNGCFPLDVQFLNTSIPGSGTITEYLWDFGDGTTSSAQQPAHTYGAAGTYNVSLRVTNSNGCQRTLTRTNYIIANQGVTANFINAAPQSCSPPETIQFTNQSTGTGILSYQWDFGDGGTSTLQHPSHTYTATGTFSVRLIAVSITGCRDTIIHPNAITIGSVDADFTFNNNACEGSPLTFNNTSTPGPASATWTFGDGGTSALLSPVHVYNLPGTYIVKLVSNFGGCLDSMEHTVTVLSNPQAAFTGSPRVSCSAPVTVNFANTTANAASYEWLFGDGGTSILPNPSHTYNTEGVYTVTLIATGPGGCTDTLVRTDYIVIAAPQVSFNLPQMGCAPLTVAFQSSVVSVDPVVQYLWDFGDGTTGTGPNPSHTYALGSYDVQLIIITAGGCRDTVFMPAGVIAASQPAANFSATPLNVCAFMPVNFTDLSTGSITTWHWLFGDGGSSTAQNPGYIYSDTGYMDVTLIVGNNGCFDTIVFNDYIHVDPPIARFNVTYTCQQKMTRFFTDQSIGADTWSWNFGDGGTSGAQSPSHTYAAPGTYTVSLTVTNIATGCSYTQTSQVLITNQLAGFSGAPLTICRNTPVTFTADASPADVSLYAWTFGDGGVDSARTVTHVYAASGFYNVRLIVTDLNGCTDTLIKTNYVRVNGAIADFNPALPGTCLQNAITFTDLSTTDGVNPITQWTWNYGDGNVETLTGAPFQHTYANSGSYGVQLLVQDAYGCKDSIYKPAILVISNPLAVFSTPDTLTCPAGNITFTNSSTGPGLTFVWSFGDGGTSTAQNPTHSYTAEGDYTVTLTVTDQYGCISSSVRPQYIKIVYPRADFTVDDSVSTCPPLIVQFSNTSQNMATFSWDFGDGTSSTSQSPLHFYNVAGNYTAVLTITGPGGCTDTATKQIIVAGPAGSFAYSNIPGCKPHTVTFTATTINRTSFIWDFNDGTILSTTDSVLTHTYSIPGFYVPKMIIRDATGCAVPVSGIDTIWVFGSNALFDTDTLLRCGSGDIKFQNNSVSNDVITGYEWDFGDGTTSTVTSPIHTYLTEGNYSPKLKVFTQFGCTDSLVATVPVKVVRVPDADITGEANGCVPLQPNLQSVLNNPDTSAVQFQWTINNGMSGNGTAYTPQPVTVAGQYIVQLIAINSSGCRDTVTANFEAFPLPNIVAGADITICEGTAQSLTATGGVTYTWGPSTGLSCTTCSSPAANPAVPVTYGVTGESAQGCRSTDSIRVDVKYPFNLLQSPGDTLCRGQSATLTANGAFTYVWSPAAGLNNTAAATVIATPDTTTIYRVIGTDNLGCFSDTGYYDVRVYPIPVVNAGTNQTVNVGQSAVLTPTLSADVTNVLWSPSETIIASNYPAVTVKPNETTTYRLRATNNGGCRSESLVTVYVICNGANVFIPNTFSPNGDGANERFYPRGTGLFTIKLARIFNRWGEAVYQKNDFKANDEGAGWDGTFRGQKLQPDVFVYMIEIVCENNTTLLYKGNITLIR